jgi:hypothetical protein
LVPVDEDPGVLLVCAYDQEEAFRKNDLEGAISLSEFRKRKYPLPKDENIIFYCACRHDEAVTEEAQKYFREGFTNSLGWRQCLERSRLRLGRVARMTGGSRRVPFPAMGYSNQIW